MEIIIGIVLALFVVVAVVVLIINNRKEVKDIKTEEASKNIDPSCCGAHEICDFDNVKVNVDMIEYFDDEELDNYKGIAENAYSDNQIEEFREILYTLKIIEIQNWLLSLERRRIHLPYLLHEEARDLIING